MAARAAAVRLLSAVLRQQMPLDELIADGGHLASLASPDRGFARAIIATALRRKGQIDDLLTRFLDRPLPGKSGAAYEILLCGLTQLLFLDIPAHAAVDIAVNQAKYDRRAKPLAGLINAVLRRAARDGKAVIAGQDAGALNTPDWLLRRWRAAHGDETAHAIAMAHLDVPPLDISVNGDPAPWADRLGGEVLATGTVRLASAGAVEALPGFEDGAWWVQDAAAALPARLMGDVAGRRVLDLCAAPGGKTAQLAASGADVTALDRAPERIERLKANLARLGLSAETIATDALAHETSEPFDAVLLDAPCSATGTIRRHPDIPFLKSEPMIAAMAGIQSELLDKAITLTRPGGVIVYCTCSLEPEEGERVVDAALSAGAPIVRVPVESSDVAGEVKFITPAGDLRTLPSHWQDRPQGARGLDGFYACRLERRD